MEFQHITLRPSDGGQLVTRATRDVPGAANYTVKQNFRRDLPGEVRREGWSLFAPDTESEIGDQPLNAPGPISMLHMVRRPNGKMAVIAASGDKLYRFFALDDPRYVEDGYFVDPDDYVFAPSTAWIEIGSGFSTTAKRWEAVD